MALPPASAKEAHTRVILMTLVGLGGIGDGCFPSARVKVDSSRSFFIANLVIRMLPRLVHLTD